MWDIRKIISKGDYNYALVPEHPKATKNGYVLEHRIVMENHLDRLLNSDEVVHHIDHNKKNNDISNLQVMNKLEHLRYHGNLQVAKMVTFICKNCEESVTRRDNGGVHHFCSHRCNGLYNGFKSK